MTQHLTVTYGDGSTQDVAVTVVADALPPTQTSFASKTVIIGKTSGRQATLTLQPGPVVAPPPPAPATPTCTTPPQLQGGNAAGDGIICAPGVWANAATVATQLRRNLQPVGAPGQYSTWATPYVTQAGDAGATFDGIDTATNTAGVTATRASSNQIIVAAPAPPPSPTPSPSDPPTSFVVPSGWHTPNLFGTVAHDWDFTKGVVPSGWTINTGGDPAGANLQTPPTYFTNTPQTIRLDANGLGLGIARNPTGGYQAGWVDTAGAYAPAPNQRISILVQAPPPGALWLAAWIRGRRTVWNDGGPYQEFDIFELLTWQVRQWYTTVHYWPGNSPNANIPQWPFDPGVDPSAQAAWVDFFWEMLSDGPCVTTAYAGRVVAQKRALPSQFGTPPTGSYNKLVLSNGASTGQWTGPALSSANDGNLPQFMVVKRVVVRD